MRPSRWQHNALMCCSARGCSYGRAQAGWLLWCNNVFIILKAFCHPCRSIIAFGLRLACDFDER